MANRFGFVNILRCAIFFHVLFIFHFSFNFKARNPPVKKHKSNRKIRWNFHIACCDLKWTNFIIIEQRQSWMWDFECEFVYTCWTHRMMGFYWSECSKALCACWMEKIVFQFVCAVWIRPVWVFANPNQSSCEHPYLTS